MISTAASLSALMLVAACAGTPSVAAHPAPAYDADFPPAIVELHFESHGDRLNGHAYLADGPGPHPTVILLHGFPGNERNLDLAQDLRSDGFNVLLSRMWPRRQITCAPMPRRFAPTLTS